MPFKTESRKVPFQKTINVQCTVCSVQCTVYSVKCTVYCTLGFDFP